MCEWHQSAQVYGSVHIRWLTFRIEVACNRFTTSLAILGQRGLLPQPAHRSIISLLEYDYYSSWIRKKNTNDCYEGSLGERRAASVRVLAVDLPAVFWKLLVTSLYGISAPKNTCYCLSWESTLCLGSRRDVTWSGSICERARTWPFPWCVCWWPPWFILCSFGSWSNVLRIGRIVGVERSKKKRSKTMIPFCMNESRGRRPSSLHTKKRARIVLFFWIRFVFFGSWSNASRSRHILGVERNKKRRRNTFPFLYEWIQRTKAVFTAHKKARRIVEN